MARGWESKEVESQMESAAESRRAQAAAAAQPSLSDEQKARQYQLESLQMSRTRVLRDLETAKHPRHKAMLEDALQTLDQRIAALIATAS